jgi:hypothetical protein
VGKRPSWSGQIDAGLRLVDVDDDLELQITVNDMASDDVEPPDTKLA